MRQKRFRRMRTRTRTEVLVAVPEDDAVMEHYRNNFLIKNSKLLSLLMAGRVFEGDSIFSARDPVEYCRLSMTPGGIHSSTTLETGKPKLGGLMDPRQGVIIDHTKRCYTCDGNILQCPGHYGHIILSEPMFHMGFLTMVKEILSSFCFYCHKLLICASHPLIREVVKQPKKLRLSMVYHICQHITVCERVNEPEESRSGLNYFDGVEVKHDGCGRHQPRLMLNGFELIAEWRNPVDKFRKIRMNAEHARRLLLTIPDFNYVVIGMDPKIERADWLILTVLPIPPLNNHCSVLLPELMKNRDYLIGIYSNILESNNELTKSKQSDADFHVIKENLKTLQFHVVSLMYYFQREWQISFVHERHIEIQNTEL